MGSGKSTTAEMIHHVLVEESIPVRHVPEGERPHPVQAVKCRTVDEFIQQNHDKWQAFVEEARNDDTTVVFDGQILHFVVDLLLMRDADPKVIANHALRIADIANQVETTLVYFKTDDIARSMRHAFHIRGSRWKAAQIRRKTSTAYCQSRQLTGERGILDLYKKYGDICDKVFDGLPMNTLRVNPENESRGTINRRVLKSILGDDFKRRPFRETAPDRIHFRDDIVDLADHSSGIRTESDLSTRYNSELATLNPGLSSDRLPGSLRILGNRKLGSLEGLDRLKAITEFCVIVNSGLTSLAGLDQLESVGKNLSIRNNLHLTSISALKRLNDLGGGVSLRNNPKLETLDGLVLKKISGNLELVDLHRLTDLGALDELTEVEGDLEISYNDRLRSLQGLENLTRVGGRLTIEKNGCLTSLAALRSLVQVGELVVDGSSQSLVSEHQALTARIQIDNQRIE